MENFFIRMLAGLLLLPALAEAAPTNNVVVVPHARDLMVVQGGRLVRFGPDEFLKAPYTVLYFGAGWCPDCRRFLPALVTAYDRQQKAGRRFEVLLLTMDETADAMLQFMRSEKMKWPALAFDKMKSADDLRKYYSGQGIPCLTVIDQKGTVILQSKSDQDAADILKQLQDLLKTKA